MLSVLEEAILTRVGKRVRGWNAPTDSTPLIEQAVSNSYSADDVQLGIDMLEKRGYLEVKVDTLLFTTPNGYYAYADANVPGFADLIQSVELEICQHNRIDSHEVAANLQAEQIAVDYIFARMIQKGAIECIGPFWVPGPLWHVKKLSPELRFCCRELQQV